MAAHRGDSDPRPDEATLTALCSEVESLTEGVAIGKVAFVEALAKSPHRATLVERFIEGGAERTQALDGLVELRLVAALASADRRAASAIDERYFRGLEKVLSRMKLGDATVDDVLQRARQKLLVPDADGRSRIADYAGQGRLRSLVQVVVTREALDGTRRRDPLEHGDDDLFALPAAQADPELAALKARFGADFRTAFEAAVRGLTSRERNLLRMHLVSGVPLERIATVYQAHRATIVRWLAAARAAVLKATHAELRARTGASERDIDDMLELVRSRLDLSLERWFKSTVVEPDASEDPGQAGDGSQRSEG